MAPRRKSEEGSSKGERRNQSSAHMQLLPGLSVVERAATDFFALSNIAGASA